MKSISNLIPDIQARLLSNKPFNEEDVTEFSHALALKLADRLAERRGEFTLRMSNLGETCLRRLWYKKHKPELAEPLSPSARLKFLFGDVIEELIIFLARAAGHDVKMEQYEVDLHGVKGHIDAVIDGHLVDVKSASSFSFKKFAEHRLDDDDSFGYGVQLDGYLESLQDHPDVAAVSASFIAVDKQLGHITLDTHEKRDHNYEEMIAHRRNILASDKPPSRGETDIPEGKSGNRKLSVKCGYCEFNRTCWPGLRIFLYANNRPTHLTYVAREPKVPEITNKPHDP